MTGVACKDAERNITGLEVGAAQEVGSGASISFIVKEATTTTSTTTTSSAASVVDEDGDDGSTTTTTTTPPPAVAQVDEAPALTVSVQNPLKTISAAGGAVESRRARRAQGHGRRLTAMDMDAACYATVCAAGTERGGLR